MARTVIDKIECDSCGKDIGPHETSYPHAYILKLGAVDAAICGGVTFSILMRPPTKDLYFCDFNCVGAFMDKKRAREKEERETTGRRMAEATARGENFYTTDMGTKVYFGSITIG